MPVTLKELKDVQFPAMWTGLAMNIQLCPSGTMFI